VSFVSARHAADAVSERRLSAGGSRFAVATPHAEATRAAVEAFAAGGNAIDAALSAATTLSVAYPQMCGLGGDLFALVQTPDGRIVSINSSGPAPMASDADAVRSRYGSMPESGPFTVTVPGAVAGWAAAHRMGARLPWRDAFAPAIRLAVDGFDVVPGLAAAYREHLPRLAADPGARLIHTRDGRPPAVGDRVVNAALGRSLAAIADGGPSTMYGGEVGRAYARGLASLGCSMAPEDLDVDTPDELLEPLAHQYRGFEVRTSPPTSQGFVMLQALAVIERLDVDPDPLGVDVAAIALAFVRAARDRDTRLADPRFMSKPVEALLADAHLEALAADVRQGISGPRAGRAALGGTAGLVAADADGYAVSLIQSLGSGFGASILEPATGIIAQNRGSAFVLDAGDPRVLAPGRRPPHTLMPVMAHRDGRLVAVSGTMGGPAHPQINAASLIRSLQLSMAASDAVAAPRWIAGGMDAIDGVAVAEADVPNAAASSLERAGLRVIRLGRQDSSTGHAHLIVARGDGAFDAGTDPRADGEAAAA
jgi:gamma-glutamyltranspeptidase/glutathione hydrolase